MNAQDMKWVKKKSQRDHQVDHAVPVLTDTN